MSYPRVYVDFESTAYNHAFRAMGELHVLDDGTYHLHTDNGGVYVIPLAKWRAEIHFEDGRVEIR